jgi:hypothetical protein
MSQPPDRSDAYATASPRGDSTGCVSTASLSHVTGTGAVSSPGGSSQTSPSSSPPAVLTSTTAPSERPYDPDASPVCSAVASGAATLVPSPAWYAVPSSSSRRRSAAEAISSRSCVNASRASSPATAAGAPPGTSDRAVVCAGTVTAPPSTHATARTSTGELCRTSDRPPRRPGHRTPHGRRRRRPPLCPAGACAPHRRGADDRVEAHAPKGSARGRRRCGHHRSPRRCPGTRVVPGGPGRSRAHWGDGRASQGRGER